MTKPRRRWQSDSHLIISLGFSAVILTLLAIIILGAVRFISIEQAQHSGLQERNHKVELISSMREIVRKRTLSMVAISIYQDDFARDEEFMAFIGQAGHFVGLRDDFLAMDLSQRERALFDRVLGIIRITQPLQEHIVEQLMEDNREGIDEYMAMDLPLEKELLTVFEKLIAEQRLQTELAAQRAEQQYQSAYQQITLLGILAFLFSLAILFHVLKRTRRIEQQLFEEKELAEVTLQAIGDAVIATDRYGNTSYLNPEAERLTGWRLAEARGRPVSEIYQTFDERTMEPVPHPLYIENVDALSASLHRFAILREKDGTTHVVQDNVSPIRDRDGHMVGKVLTFRDMTAAREIETQLLIQANQDPLTGLLNRRAFEVALGEYVYEARTESSEHVLMYLDLDQFKVVNDTCGHEAGDELLKQVALSIRSRLRQDDVVARLGGDEFGVLLTGCQLDNAVQVAELLRQAIDELRFSWHHSIFRIGVSIGVVAVTAESSDTATLLSIADSACYMAKDKGRNQVWVNQPGDSEMSQRMSELAWVSQIHEALDNDDFEVHAQTVLPVINGTDLLPYHELLIRMYGPSGDLIPPGSFIPAAERYGAMIRVDAWMLEQLIALVESPEVRDAEPAIYAINISGKSVSDPKFREQALARIAQSRRGAHRLCLEITETAAILNLQEVACFIRELHALNCACALDDYGSGLSSFHTLKHLPVDYVKIDGSLIRDICSDGIDLAMVETINRIAHELGMTTIAEFVETTDIMHKIAQLGVDYAQGYLIHRPAAIGGEEPRPSSHNLELVKK
ncbi:MAG TPA: EAL domain-containing protein [Gammaproteobacteria bacterium]|nr:EAL domain-containing protein [Gammaproteobacteria bacterium]